MSVSRELRQPQRSMQAKKKVNVNSKNRSETKFYPFRIALDKVKLKVK